jgi:hypothetical protein
MNKEDTKSVCSDEPSAQIEQCGSTHDFIGAGVLPYTITGGRVKFFLGKELSKGRTLTGKHKYCWSDFGGKKDEDGRETAEATATREFSEETLGMWGGMGPLRERVQNSNHAISQLLQHSSLPPAVEAPAHACSGGQEARKGGLPKTRSFVLKNGLYVTFVLPLPYVDPLLFQLARDENDSTLPGAARDSETSRSAEKRDWAWVDATALLDSCVSKGRCRTVDQEGQVAYCIFKSMCFTRP